VYILFGPEVLFKTCVAMKFVDDDDDDDVRGCSAFKAILLQNCYASAAKK